MTDASAKRDIPVIFSAPMVLALLAGRKTMTRRLAGAYRPIYKDADELVWKPSPWQRVKPGDVLWVRETWQTGMSCDGPQITYRATPDYFEIDAWDGPDEGAGPSFNYDKCPGATWSTWLPDLISGSKSCRWRPPIHTPRWASRLTLEVTAIKIERLQGISEEDSLAEGILEYPDGFHWEPNPEPAYVRFAGKTARQAFLGLWEKLHGAVSLAANPEVVAITSRVHHENIIAFNLKRAS